MVGRVIAALALLASGTAALAGNGYYNYYPTYYTPYYQPTYNYNWVYYPAEGSWPAGYYANTTAGWLYKPGYVAPTYTAQTSLPYSTNWKAEGLKLIEKRDDLAAWEAFNAKLGTFSSNYSLNYGYAYPPVVGTYGAQGSTQYGVTYQTLANAYGSLDQNVMFQQMNRWVENAQNLGGQATAQGMSLVGQANAGANLAAQTIAKGIAATSVLKAAEPAAQASIQTTVTTAQNGGVQYGTGQQQRAQDVLQQQPRSAGPPESEWTEFRKTVAAPQCGQCHSGDKPRGKFAIDMLPQLDVNGKAALLWRLTTTDAKRGMPRDGDQHAPLSDQQKQPWFRFLMTK